MKLKPHHLYHFTAVTAELHCLSPNGFSCVQAAPAGKKTNKTEFNTTITAKTWLQKLCLANVLIFMDAIIIPNFKFTQLSDVPSLCLYSLFLKIRSVILAHQKSFFFSPSYTCCLSVVLNNELCLQRHSVPLEVTWAYVHCGCLDSWHQRCFGSAVQISSRIWPTQRGSWGSSSSAAEAGRFWMASQNLCILLILFELW